jgi:hypothetical protein
MRPETSRARIPGLVIKSNGTGNYLICPHPNRDAFMSTVSTSQGPRQALPDEPDPLRFGWRYVTLKQSDGSESMELVPLTLEDALHPEDGDHIVHSLPEN